MFNINFVAVSEQHLESIYFSTFEKLLHYTHTHTHPFNGSLSGTTRVSRYQKGKTNLDFTGARDSEWQWHNREPHQHPTNQFFTGRMPFLPPNQQRQSTEGTVITYLLHYTLKTYLVYVLAATKKCGVCVSHPICSHHT